MSDIRLRVLENELSRCRHILQQIENVIPSPDHFTLCELGDNLWLQLPTTLAVDYYHEKVSRFETGIRNLKLHLLQTNPANATVSEPASNYSGASDDGIIEIEEQLDEDGNIISSQLKRPSGFNNQNAFKSKGVSQLDTSTKSSNTGVQRASSDALEDAEPQSQEPTNISSNLYELELIAREIEDIESTEAESSQEFTDVDDSEDDSYADDLLYGTKVSLLPKNLTLDERLLEQIRGASQHDAINHSVPNSDDTSAQGGDCKKVRFKEDREVKEVENISESLSEIRHKKGPLKFKGARMKDKPRIDDNVPETPQESPALLDITERNESSDEELITANFQINDSEDIGTANKSNTGFDLSNDGDYSYQEKDSLDEMAIAYYRSLYDKREKDSVFVDNLEDFEHINKIIENSNVEEKANEDSAMGKINDSESPDKENSIMSSDIIERDEDEDDFSDDNAFFNKEIEEDYLRLKTKIALREDKYKASESEESPVEGPRFSHFKEARLNRR